MVNINCEKLICPICGQPLTQQGSSLVCPTRHSYDIARQGYINLLPVQQKHSLTPGDTPEMLAARRRFLNRGYYTPICNAVLNAIKKYSRSPEVIADIGCGEGYYTSQFLINLPKSRIIGADIAKSAVKMACSRTKDISWLVATASHLPIQSSSANVVTAMFSLLCEEEFARILHDGGIVVEVTAGTRHLIELKEIIYDDVFEQNKHPKEPQGFLQEISCELHSFTMSLNQEELADLLQMTPHTLRIKPENRKNLDEIPSLNLTAEYYVRVLQK